MYEDIYLLSDFEGFIIQKGLNIVLEEKIQELLIKKKQKESANTLY